VNKTGKVVIPIKYDDVHDFHEGWTNVVLHGQKCVIDKKGKVIMDL
jgi:hypothetical protein